MAPPDFKPVVTHIDRRTCTRDRPMEVLCLGLSRTGTDSMRTALKILGYNDVYHGFSVGFENPTDAHMWYEAGLAKYEGIGKPFEKKDWDQLLGHCNAVTDLPCCQFSTELLSAYPDAKVILTTRDIDSWYDSALSSVLASRDSWIGAFINMMHPDGRLTQFKSWKMWDWAWEGDFRKNGKRIHVEHNEHVRKLAKGRLLEFKVEQGWEPLCKFLSKPIPDTPFPHRNGGADFYRVMGMYTNRRLKETAWNLLLYTSTLGAVVGALYYGHKTQLF